MSHDLPKSYDPTIIEERWAKYWVQEHLFDVANADAFAAGREEVQAGAETFVQLLPPPNVTGRLHMGHMLNQTEMDILTRWHRMLGDVSLWVPGTDHAGIATQMMVERQLAAEGKTRQELGRKAFEERVWKWKCVYGGAILEQMKRLGASVDWRREYFTMDDRLSVAVKEAFVRLWEQGLIYRGAYIVNWDPVMRTAVSDLEVTHEERAGKLYHMRYPLADGTGSIVIATTRPETMLGDVAVAVNPDDERYKALVGKLVKLPLSGVNGGAEREIPILADDWAKPEFGTGAVKVTPAHDPNDFAIGQRHNLPSLNILDETARVALPGSPYDGMDRYVAREKIVEDLRERGLLVDVKEHTLAIGVSQRSGVVIEPRLSKQWFLAVTQTPASGGSSIAQNAIDAVRDGYIRFTPEMYSKTYFEWMNNIHDWCISRQLWWGHQIPAWHCGCGQITVSRETPKACDSCGSAEIVQETDVLDTWFSSGLLPFTVFGWPNADASGAPTLTPDLAAFYPTQLLVTGFDILFFWVARMIMLGCHFMLDVPTPDGRKRTLADAVPFREVYIHALVRDADRQKMSKTKGNVIDPIDIINKYGTDAVRFTLASMASPGTDIAFSEGRTDGYRAFANKIWNSARFVFMQVERAKEVGIVVDYATLAEALEVKEDFPLEARWIISRLSQTVGSLDNELSSLDNEPSASVNRALANFRFDEAANHIYQFFWGDLCDWYLEIIKLRLDFSETANKVVTADALTTLLAVFEAALRMLSPFMPFITEEIWHAFYDGNPPAKSIALAEYPKGAKTFSTSIGREIVRDTFADMSRLQNFIRMVRNLRKERSVPEKLEVAVTVYAEPAVQASLKNNFDIIQRLARVSEIRPQDAKQQGLGSLSHAGFFEIDIDYEVQIDVTAERERLTKDLAKYEKGLAAADKQLGNEAFMAKAPAHIVEGLRKQAAETKMLHDKTKAALDALPPE